MSPSSMDMVSCHAMAWMVSTMHELRTCPHFMRYSTCHAITSDPLKIQLRLEDRCPYLSTAQYLSNSTASSSRLDDQVPFRTQFDSSPRFASKSYRCIDICSRILRLCSYEHFENVRDTHVVIVEIMREEGEKKRLRI